MEVSEVVVKSAVKLAKGIKANVILVLTETGNSFDLSLKYNKTKIPMIVATPEESTFQKLVKKTMIGTIDVDFLDVDSRKLTEKVNLIKLMTRGVSSTAQIEDAVAMGVSRGLLKEGDIAVVITSSFEREADSVVIYDVRTDMLDYTLYEFLRNINVRLDVFDAVLNIALEIGREGREGRLIGTAFLLGDSKKMMENSKQLLLNPFEGQLVGERLITNRDLHESIKELAQIDGAFIVNGDGIVEAAGRYLTVDPSSVGIPRGLGTRHAAVAAMTAVTDSVGITVSQSGGIVRIFKEGEAIMTIEPQKRIVFRTDIK
ncbi:MAG: diadenylate cyclase [Candidatus Hydrothermarchaeota archaeon]|nr:diadenylate cyclase [Candidatus Hydrothermarchaeota archaeon]